MKKTKIFGPAFWISPQENLLETPMIKLISKLSHRRCTSGKISPYKDRSSLLKLKSVIKSNTRQQSPKLLKNNKNSPMKSYTSKKLLNKPLSNPIKKKIKSKKKNSLNQLNYLKGKQRFKAPKIFDNQIFIDVYDEAGNHDRIMETIEITESFPEIVDEEKLYSENVLIVPKEFKLKNKEYDATEHNLRMKQPENSFIQETEDNLKINNVDLFSKLQQLAKDRNSM